MQNCSTIWRHSNSPLHLYLSSTKPSFKGQTSFGVILAWLYNPICFNIISRSRTNDINCAQIPEVSLKGTVTDENSHSVTQWCSTVAVQQVVWRIISRLFCAHHHMLYVFSSGSPCQLMKYHLCWCACTTDMEIHISGSDEDVDAFGRNEVSLQSEHLGHIRAIESRTSGDITVIQLTYFIGIDDRISGHIHKLEMNSCYRNLVPVVYDCTHKTIPVTYHHHLGNAYMCQYARLSLVQVMAVQH